LGEAMVCILGQPMTRGDPLHFVPPSHLALYQHACYEVPSSCHALSVKTALMVTPLPETLCVMVALPPRHRATVPLVTEMVVEGQHGAQPVMGSWG
jgi:hypothetical protein